MAIAIITIIPSSIRLSMQPINMGCYVLGTRHSEMTDRQPNIGERLSGEEGQAATTKDTNPLKRNKQKVEVIVKHLKL